MRNTVPIANLYKRAEIDLSNELPKVRKICLEELLKTISNPTSNEDRDITFSILKLVVRHFEDLSECCRELSVKIALFCLHSWTVSGESTVFLMLPIIEKRFCVESYCEKSEEIRLLLIDLVTTIVNKYPNEVSFSSEKIINILVHGIGDCSPDVKKGSFKCASVVAKTVIDFQQHSDIVITSIIPMLKHKHYRVRVSAINALSDIVLFGRNESVKQVCGALGESLLDQNAHVRVATLRTVAVWCQKLRDRYSYFYYLIPLMLSGLSDENDQYREEAERLWHDIGVQYIAENEDKLKDHRECLSNELENYPNNVKRPNLGCRIIVRNEMGKIITTLMIELEDWIPEVRIKSSILLISLALHAEETTVTFLEQILPTLYRAVSDSKDLVSRNVLRAVEIIGYFVPSKMYWPLLVSHIKENQSVGKYAILASLLKQRPKTEIFDQLSKIVPALAEDDICETREICNLEYLLAIISKVIDCCESYECDEKVVIDLYMTLIIIMASSKNLEECAMGLITKLFRTLPQSESHLIKLCVFSIMKRLRNNCDMWESHSRNFNIFIVLLSRFADDIIKLVPDTVFEILIIVLNPQGDREMIFKILFSIAELLENKKETHLRIQFVRKIISDPLRSLLMWNPGRVAEVIRATALSIILLFLKSIDELDNEFIAQLTPIILSLCEDGYEETRIYALETIALMVKHIEYNDLEIFCGMLTCTSKRLDDKCNKVRLKTLQIVKILLLNVPSNSLEKLSKVDNVSKALSLVFLNADDDNPTIQELVLDLFKEESIVRSIKKMLDEKLISSLLSRCYDKNVASLLEKYLNI